LSSRKQPLPVESLATAPEFYPKNYRTTMTKKQEKNIGRWPKIRKFLNDIHLWVGLASGLVVFVVCLSGTVYVFNTEFREMATPELYHVEATGSRLSPNELITRVKAQKPGEVLSIKITELPTRAYTIVVKEPEAPKKKEAKDGKKSGEAKPQKGEAGPKGGEGNRGPSSTSYMVNPYTGEVLGDARAKTATSEFMGTLFSLHRWLLLDKIEEPLIGELPNRKLGSYITGFCTILFTIGVITGLFIWFPQKLKSWKQGLKIKWNGSWKRTNHDLHNSLGFYACILLFLMGVTGPFFSFDWYREYLRKSLGTYQPQDAPKPADPASQIPVSGQYAPLSIMDYIQAADQALPYPGDYTISLPSDSTAAVAIKKNRTGFFAPSAGDQIMLDQYSAQVISVDIFREKPFNERVSGSVKALHLGDVYGMFSKILYFFACLIATSLPVTGTMIWLNKMKKPKKRPETAPKSVTA
jgi:uncharacterized iron-regulated membrane protein